MKESLYVLVIDDNPDDRALVIRELRRQFSPIEIEEITDADSFAGALKTGRFNFVITDYQLLWTDGLTVLRAIKAQMPECPVVMFTGTGSEEVAVEAMKSGLDDYVLKSPKHYSRLPAAAKMALKMAHQRHELREAESRYTSLFSTVPVGLYRTDPSGNLLDANPALAEMLGYDNPADLISVNASDLFVHSEDHVLRQNLLSQNGLVYNFEAQLRRRDGTACWVQDNATMVCDERGHQTFCEGSLEDITDRKKAELEREELITELQEALAQVKTLSGLLPICAACKKIRDDNGYWNQIEVFIQEHSDAEFTHSFCPDCMKRLYPEVFNEGVRVS
jgi:PAS domain S-box-containing protein